MTRSVWLKADNTVGSWEERKHRITAGLEAGVDWVLVDETDVGRVRELGSVKVAAFKDAGEDEVDIVDASMDMEPDIFVVGKRGEGDGTVDLPSDFSGSADLTTLRRKDDRAQGSYVRIFDEEYEEFAEAAARDAEYTIVATEDWDVIPLENLIARVGTKTNLVAGVDSAEAAATAFETLERGVDDVLLDTDDPDEMKNTIEVRDRSEQETLELSFAEITQVEETGLADRVCIDTGSLLDDDEGMLVGSLSRGLFFVHGETADSPYVASRPFRVNAGAVHAYVRTAEGETKYLAELQSGDRVQVVDVTGHTRKSLVGRVKIERRPMFRVQAEVTTDDDDEVDVIETLLQNAETVKVSTKGGRKAVTELEAGDEVRVYYEEGGRHFGEKVEESIIEK